MTEQKTFKPPGTLVTSYKQNNEEYEIYKGYLNTDKAMRDYHQKIELFVVLTIETANFINSEDPWEVYLLYVHFAIFTHHSECKRKCQMAQRIPYYESPISYHSRHYALIGFSTVYDFYSFPNGIRKRISQFLILPPFQKRGHGGIHH